MANKKEEEIGFEAAFQKLEAIVESLEGGQSTLDEAMEVFEEGMRLIRVCNEKLTQAETRLHRLLKKDDGGFQLDLVDGNRTNDRL